MQQGCCPQHRQNEASAALHSPSFANLLQADKNVKCLNWEHKKDVFNSLSYCLEDTLQSYANT